MSARVAATASLYAAFLAAWAAGLALRGRGPSRALVAGAILLELTLVAQAVASLVAWLGDGAPAAPAEHGGYLAASVLLGPLACAYARGERAASAVLGVGALALAVVSLRLRATWVGD